MNNSEKGKVLFWAEDPNILLNQTYILEFFPTHIMSYNQQLNAITRTVLLLTGIIMFISPSFRVLVISLITIFMIYLMFYFKNKENLKEGLEQQKNIKKRKTQEVNQNHMMMVKLMVIKLLLVPVNPLMN